MREFNVNAICVPEQHYMVDITNKLNEIKKLIDKQKYFTINRGRQYGKTTTLLALEKFLADEYTVIAISFEGIGNEEFASAANFCQAFIKLIAKALRFAGVTKEYRESWLNSQILTFSDLSDHITDMCEDKKLVLLIDEVDKTSNNVVFLNFLGKLRDKYISRSAGKDFTFHSVILAGVYDIKNIKLRLVQEGLHTPLQSETVINNSPWNIAADFEVDMSFSAPEIETMLVDYENEHKMGMNIVEIATEIYNYTSGYPVLVSRICKYIDEDFNKQWTLETVRKAVKLISMETSPLFDSLIKNLTSNNELFILTKRLLMEDFRWRFNPHDELIGLGVRYGYLTNEKNRVKIANKIFEICLTNYFISYDERQQALTKPVITADEDGIITASGFNMQTCLERFAKYYYQYYNERDINFIEREASKLFLMFLSSVLNGEGFVYIETGLADGRSMDIVATYQGQQFIIETKIWYGEKRHDAAYDQLQGYMDKMSLTEGYLLTFDFSKTKKNHQKWVELEDGRKIFDVMV